MPTPASATVVPLPAPRARRPERAAPFSGPGSDTQHVAQAAADAGLHPTVSIAQRAAELLTDVGTCAELIDAVTRGPERTRYAAGMALMVTAVRPASEMAGMARIRDLVVRAALDRAAAEIAAERGVPQ